MNVRPQLKLIGVRVQIDEHFFVRRKLAHVAWKRQVRRMEKCLRGGGMRSSIDAADVGILVVVPNATDVRAAFVQMRVDTLGEQVLQCVEARPTAANDNGTMFFSGMQKDRM